MAEKKNRTTKQRKVVKNEKPVKKTKKTKVFKNFMDFIKKNKTVLIIVLVATIINALVVYAGVKDSTSKANGEKITAGYVHYWVQESKEDGALITIFCQDGKKYCNEYEPTVRQVATDYQLPVYWVDLGSITDVEYQEIVEAYKDLQGIKIPYTLVTQKGEKVAGVEGSLDSDSLIKTLSEIGLIESE